MVWRSRLHNLNVTMSLYISNDITFKNWNAAVVAALGRRRHRRRRSCVLVSDLDPWPLPASVVAALWGLCCLLSLASVPTKLLRFPTIMSSAHGSRMLPISFTELGMHRQRRRQQQLRRRCFSRPDLIKIRRYYYSVPYIFSSALCFFCRRSKSAGFLSGISFPLLCVSCRRSKSAGSLCGISFLCSVFLVVVQNPRVLCPAFLFQRSVLLSSSW